MMDVSKNVFGVQLAFFFSDNSEISILKLASKIQEAYKAMFPIDPQILPLPNDAPPEVPRCIFQNPDGSASLTFSSERLDFKAGIKANASWKNFQEVVAYALLQIFNSSGIGIRRIGLIVQASVENKDIPAIDEVVLIDKFHESAEKNLSWVNQEKKDDEITVNIVNNIQINHNNAGLQNIITIDVNTHNDTPLKENEKVLDVIGYLLSKIEERLKDVI